MLKNFKKIFINNFLFRPSIIILIFLISCTIPGKDSDNDNSKDNNKRNNIEANENSETSRAPAVISGPVKVGPFTIYQVEVEENFEYIAPYDSNEVMVFDMQTCSGDDTANVRTKIENNKYYVKIEEDQSKDDETNHSLETVIGIRVKKGLITAKGVNIGEAGSKNIKLDSTHEWYTVNMQYINTVGYTHPVVIASVATYNGNHECHVRIKDVTSTSFKMKLEEWPFRTDGTHNTETVNYIVINGSYYDTGVWHGYYLGKDENGNAGGYWGISAWSRKVSMSNAGFYTEMFYGPDYISQNPFIITTIQSCESGVPIVTRVSKTDYSYERFSYKYQKQELDEKSNSNDHKYNEVIGHLAIGPIDDIPDGGSSDIVKTKGWLQVKNNKLYNQPGNKVVQLKGMSAFWMNWDEGKKFANHYVIGELINNWDITVYRASMGVRPIDPKESGDLLTPLTGYVDYPEKNLETLENVIESCIRRGIYVIVDWHVHDALASANYAAALDFFDYISDKYSNTKNIIYEVWNEPGREGHKAGNRMYTWSGDIKPYCKEIIEIIRGNGANNIIICPSPCWCQWTDEVDEDPFTSSDFPGHSSYAKNIMYSFHFYAGSHTPNGMNPNDLGLPDGKDFNPELPWQPNADPFSRLNSSINEIPIFVTEWGTTLYDGGQKETSKKAYTKSSDVWIKYMKDNGVSWCNWSICDKNEGASALKSGASVFGNWSSSNLSDSGKYIKGKIQE